MDKKAQLFTRLGQCGLAQAMRPGQDKFICFQPLRVALKTLHGKEWRTLLQWHANCIRGARPQAQFFMKDDPELQAIVRALAHYLYANPLASDSAGGIRRWWFDEEFLGPEYLLDRAIYWMKEHGLIEELAGSDGRVRWRRIGSDEQMRALLAEPGNGRRKTKS